jgi:hypothetical protein
VGKIPIGTKVLGTETGRGFEASCCENYSAEVDFQGLTVLGGEERGNKSGLWGDKEGLSGSGIEDLDVMAGSASLVEGDKSCAAIKGFETETAKEFVAIVYFVCLRVFLA